MKKLPPPTPRNAAKIHDEEHEMTLAAGGSVSQWTLVPSPGPGGHSTKVQ
jgi:hypothetical protein